MLRSLLPFLSCLGLSLAAPPEGFTVREVAKGLHSPSCMAFLPDGRLLVGEQEGDIRLVEKDTLRDRPFLTVKADAYGQRGLMGLALDPDFAANPYLYVYYTASSPVSHNRLSRFPVTGNIADSSREEILFDLPEVGTAVWHMGGGLAFGPDGKLYCATGEQQKPAESQNPASPLGKILRINRDGSIPTDNPFFASGTGLTKAIWASGLRNPFTMAVRPGDGKLFANDVGESSFEEIDSLSAGGNYGWPIREGRAADPKYSDPAFAYSHNNGCAIMGGDFYSPAHLRGPGPTRFPAGYAGKYFFAEFCRGTIQTWDPATGTAAEFLDKASYPTGLRFSPGGSLYYLSRGYDTGPNAGEIKRGLSKVIKVFYGKESDAVLERPRGSRAKPRITMMAPTSGRPSILFRIETPIPGGTRIEILDAAGQSMAAE